MAEWVLDGKMKVTSRLGRKAEGYQLASGRNDSNSNRINKRSIITSKHKDVRSIYDSSLMKFQYGTLMEMSPFYSDLQVLVFFFYCCCRGECFDVKNPKCNTF